MNIISRQKINDTQIQQIKDIANKYYFDLIINIVSDNPHKTSLTFTKTNFSNIIQDQYFMMIYDISLIFDNDDVYYL